MIAAMTAHCTSLGVCHVQFTRLNALYREEQKQKRNGGADHAGHDSH